MTSNRIALKQYDNLVMRLCNKCIKEDGFAEQSCDGAQDDKAQEKEEGSDEDETEEQKISKRKRKLESRLKIAELKQTCPRPEVVEVWDVTAQDPRLLVYLKVSLPFYRKSTGSFPDHSHVCQHGHCLYCELLLLSVVRIV